MTPTDTGPGAGKALGADGGGIAGRRSDVSTRESVQAQASATIVACDWTARESNTLRGFCTLRLPSGLVLHDCSVHQKGDRRWIGLPGRPALDSEGRQRTDPVSGKRVFMPCVSRADHTGAALWSRNRGLAVANAAGAGARRFIPA